MLWGEFEGLRSSGVARGAASHRWKPSATSSDAGAVLAEGLKAAGSLGLESGVEEARAEWAGSPGASGFLTAFAENSSQHVALERSVSSFSPLF